MLFRANALGTAPSSGGGGGGRAVFLLFHCPRSAEEIPEVSYNIGIMNSWGCLNCITGVYIHNTHKKTCGATTDFRDLTS